MPRALEVGDRLGETPGGDGRRLRRERNRRAVVVSLLQLYSEDRLRPSSAEVAERAGLSPRSLFRYFEDVNDLAAAAIEAARADAEPLLALAATAGDPFAARVAALAAGRRALFEQIGPAARAARVFEAEQPMVARGLAEGRRFLRAQVAQLFAAELNGPASASQLAAVDVATSFEAWELLRRDQRLNAVRAQAVMETALTLLLSPVPIPR